MIRPACYLRRREGWQPPSPDEWRELLREHNLTASQAGKLAGLMGSDATIARRIRSYQSGERETPFHVWRILVLELQTDAALNAIPMGGDKPPAFGADPDFDAGLQEDL